MILVGVPQVVGEHGHAPRSAFGGGGHDLDRGVECGGEDLLRDLRRGEDAAVADERVDGDASSLVITSMPILTGEKALNSWVLMKLPRLMRASGLRANSGRPSGRPARNSPERNG